MANWHYYNDNSDKIGVTGNELKELARTGVITRDTIVETDATDSDRSLKHRSIRCMCVMRTLMRILNPEKIS